VGTATSINEVFSLEDVLTSETFKKNACLYERCIITGFKVAFVPSAGALGFTAYSKDDSNAYTPEQFMRSPSLRTHNLMDRNTTSARTLSTVDLKHISGEPMATSQVTTLLQGANYQTSLKLYIPDIAPGTICATYITWTVKFLGSNELDNTQYAALTANF